jgi:hypothetical protein
MKSKKFLLITLGIILAGCVPSLLPLYTPKDVVYDPKLIGVWTDPNSPYSGTWEFRGIPDSNSYLMIYTDEKRSSGVFVVILMKLDKMLFLDVFPIDDPNLQINSLYAIHFLPVHTFMKVEQIEPTLKLRLMDVDKFTKRLEKNPQLLKYEVIYEASIFEKKQLKIVLTASTKELQDFMRKHANDSDVFGEPSNMKHVQPPDGNRPTDPNAKK